MCSKSVKKYKAYAELKKVTFVQIFSNDSLVTDFHYIVPCSLNTKLFPVP